MKYGIRILIMLLFVACSGAKNQYKIEKKPIMMLKEAYYQSYVAGVRGGGSGINIFLELDRKNSNEVELNGLYFRKKYTALKPQGSNKYQAYIKGKSNWKTDEEVFVFKNQKKKIKESKKEEEFPFTLDVNEAIIAFVHKGKLKYAKVRLVKKEMETEPQ